MNADTVLVEPIASALDWLDRHPEYAVLTINMLNAEGVSKACTGTFPSPLRLILLRSMLTAPEQFGRDDSYEVDWVQGSFLLIPREQWRAVGGLDERYFMYVEDVDLCKRVRDRGLKCAYLPLIHYIHFGGYSSARFSDQARSLGIYVSQHMRGARRLSSWFVLCIGCLGRSMFFGVGELLGGNEIPRTISKVSWVAFKELLEKGLSS